MPTYTPNLNLKKPSTGEYYDVVADNNDSKDKIDAGVGNIAGQVAEVKTSLAQNAKIVGKGGSFVDKMVNLMRVRGLYAYKNAGLFKIGIGLNDTLKSVVEYRFLYNADNLLLLRGVFAGVESTLETDTAIQATLTGTFSGTEPHRYTATVGNTIQSVFKGVKAVNFKRLTESRGGIWEFNIKRTGESVESQERKVLSCYNDVQILKESPLFDNLDPLFEYTVIGTFLGADPLHAPSTAPARGYIYYKELDLLYRPLVIRDLIRPLESTTAKEIISSASIPDFAISAKPFGAIYGGQWVPAHSVSSVSTGVLQKIQIDSDDVGVAVGLYPAFTYRQLDDFELSQTFNAVNPGGADGTMWEHTVNHTIRKNAPYLAIQNSMKFLQETDVGAAYLGMLPSKQSTMKNLVLNNGVIYDPLPTDGSDITFDWGVTSALFTGEYTVGNAHGCAIDVSSMADGAGLGKLWEPETPGRINFRADDIAKLYFVENKPNYKFVTGDRLNCEQKICCITGVRSPNLFMKSLY